MKRITVVVVRLYFKTRVYFNNASNLKSSIIIYEQSIIWLSETIILHTSAK